MVRSWVVIVALGLAGSSCKGDGEKKQAAEVLSAQGDLGEEEDALLSRRDSLLATRLKLRTRRAELDQKRQALRQQGGDTSEVDREAQALLAEESELVSQEKQFNRKLDTLLGERRAMVAALAAVGGAGDVGVREAGVAAREKDLARREQKLAEREAALSAREEGLATKWRDSCAGGTTAIATAPGSAGTRYTRRDVEPLLARTRSVMNKKGILRSDLPDPVRTLESEATRAMAKGDYGQARLAASQLYGTVRSIKVNKGFIAAKISRLNQAMKGRKLSASAERLFREATGHVADGQFGPANRKLNRIYSSIN